MSNPFKAIGKIFKKIAKVVKKIALPALAVAAVVLTGGAALGVLPSVGAVLGTGGLGLSAGLTSVLTTAGQGALMGGLGSVVSGGSFLKGATSGFIGGAAVGGLNQVLRPAVAAASGPMSSPGTVDYGGITEAGEAAVKANVTSMGSSALPASSGAGGLNSVLSGAATVSPVVQPAQTVLNAGVAGANAGVQQVAQQASGGIGKFLGSQPYLLPSLIQGVGSGLSAASAAKAERRMEEERAERKAANYAGSGNFYTDETSNIANVTPRETRAVWQIDPVTGRPYKEYRA